MNADRVVLMAPIPAGVHRDVQIEDALQTRKVLFEPWSAEIKDGYTSELDTIGEVFREILDKEKSRENESKTFRKIVLIVEGHADKRGSEEKNLKISQERADAIRDYLVEKHEIGPSRIATKGYGYYKPFAPGNDEEAYDLNRRVEFRRDFAE